jgi:hypothetical protein
MDGMICLKDGSPMRDVLVAPEFTVYACVAACHHVRVGDPPPPPRGTAETRELNKYFAKQRVWKDDTYCDIVACSRLHAENSIFCTTHRDSVRRKARKWHKKINA